MRMIIVLAGLTAAVGLAPSAQADPDPDASFLAALNKAGITYHSGPDAVGIGRRVCQLMDQGHTEPDVIKGMTQENSGFTSDAATRFARIAESTYCPQHIDGAAIPPTTTPWTPLPMFPLPAPPPAM